MIKVNSERLWSRMVELARCGEHDDPAEGVTRHPYSPIYRQAADKLIQWMEEAGMETRMDAAGNIYGKLPAAKDGPVVLTGSHLDTVPHGGYFDGLAGVIAGLEVVTRIHEENLPLQYPIELVAFVNEEGCRFLGGTMGSHAAIGRLTPEYAEKNIGLDGVCLRDAMLEFGADPDHLQDAGRQPGEILAMYELHIEQAKLLEQQGFGVGIVTHIAGIHQIVMHFYGVSDHCGGTPMDQRHDAMAAAAQLAVWLENTAKTSGSPTRATVGYITATPGMHNIIANTAEVPIDLREKDPEVRDAIYSGMIRKIEELCEEKGLTWDLRCTLDARPVASDPRILALHHASAKAQGVPVLDMVSYAAHDSMVMANICPTGMIFLRCEKGLSHCPQENITPQDLEDGTNVLLASVLHTAQYGLPE